MLPEVMAEALHEISAEPITFAIEFVQFGLLVFVIKAVGFGFRGRKGMVTNMLAERRERVSVALADAASAAEELTAAREIATGQLREARAGARERVSEARKAAERDAEAAIAALDGEVAEIRAQADETLAKERAEMLGGVHDQLVDLVTQATRQVLDEGFSAAEQRALIQKSVVESLDELESVTLQ